MNSHRISQQGHYLRPSVTPWMIAALGIALAACFIGWALSLTELDAWFFVENGPVELVECAFLMLALLPMSLAAMRAKGWNALACAALVVVISLMIVREMPRCDGPFSERGLCIATDYKTVAYVVLPLGLVLYSWIKKPLAGVEGRFAPFALINALLWAWPLGIGAALLVSAQGAEALHWQEMEEMLELAAYLYLALLGFWVVRNVDILSDRGSIAQAEPRLEPVGIGSK